MQLYSRREFVSLAMTPSCSQLVVWWLLSLLLALTASKKGNKKFDRFFYRSPFRFPLFPRLSPSYLKSSKAAIGLAQVDILRVVRPLLLLRRRRRRRPSKRMCQVRRPHAPAAAVLLTLCRHPPPRAPPLLSRRFCAPSSREARPPACLSVCQRPLLLSSAAPSASACPFPIRRRRPLPAPPRFPGAVRQ